MRKIIAVLLLPFAYACASQRNNAPSIAQPEITIEQLTSAPVAAEHMTGGIPVQLRMTVTNKAQFAITLKRVDVVSIGSGGYNVGPTSHPFNATVLPGETTEVEFWVAAYATTSVAGVNGAVALRLTSQFESPSGTFQNVAVRQVMGRQ